MFLDSPRRQLASRDFGSESGCGDGFRKVVVEREPSRFLEQRVCRTAFAGQRSARWGFSVSGSNNVSGCRLYGVSG